MESNAIELHLTKEESLYKELISVLQAETENLVSRDFRALYETVGRKEHILKRIELSGVERLKLVRDASEKLGLKPGPKGEFPLSDVIERSGASRAALESKRNIIISLVESIKELNHLNGLVVKGSLDNINKTLGFLGNFLQTGVYRQSGAFDGFATVKGAHLSEGA
ncbi:MAG: flagellar protein FlgN [Deltaproteobacteria bacterium]|nr:flagellar protein FlgN [Deltaproteobacteria bacterium]